MLTKVKMCMVANGYLLFMCTCCRYTAALIALLSASVALAQHTVTGETRWSAEALVFQRLSERKQRVEPTMNMGESEGSRSSFRVGAAYHWTEDFHAAVALEHLEVRSGGAQNNVTDSTWTTGDWFISHHFAYRADEVTIGHEVNSLFLGVGVRSGLVGHGRVALRAELQIGSRVVHATANFGTRHVSGVISNGLIPYMPWEIVASGGTAIAAWDQHTRIARRTAMGLSSGMAFRLHLHVGPHLSFIVPDIQVSVPVVKPAYDAVEEGAVRIPAHKLDLVYGIFGIGLAVHW